MRTKLVIVEGIPGSGKTTTAQFVRDWYDQQGAIPHLYLEGDLNHPADYESVACLDQNEYTGLIARHGEQKALLEHSVDVKGHDSFFSYRKLKNEYGDQVPEALLTELARYDVYELPLEKYTRLIMDRWAEFLSRSVGQDEVYIFECCFLQNPLTTLIGRHNSDISAAQATIAQLARLIERFYPVLIYLKPGNVRETLSRVAQTRPQTWVDFLIFYFTRQGYGQAHGLQGFDGVVQFYEMRQAIELDISTRLAWPKLLIDNPDGNWPQHYEQIAGFLANQR
jgi:hypothetical protein